MRLFNEIAGIEWQLVNSKMSLHLGQILLVSVCLFGQLEATFPIKCPKNEMFDECRATACQETCTNRNLLPLMKCACVSGCVCNEGYVRDPNNGKCIPRTKCPIVCPENEEFSKCGANCQNHCEDQSISFKHCACAKGCVCKQGFIRATNATNSPCIPPRLCESKSSSKHPPNAEIWDFRNLSSS